MVVDDVTVSVHLEAPVVGFQRICAEDVAGVLIFGDDLGIGDV